MVACKWPAVGRPLFAAPSEAIGIRCVHSLICRITLIVLFRWRVPEPVLIGTAPAAGLLLHRA